MKAGFMYKHRNNRDVAIQVVRSYWIPEKRGWKLKIKWFNIVNPDNVYDMRLQESIFIPRNKENDWEVYHVGSV